MNSAFKTYLLQITKSRTCKEIEVIQSLWGGYGKIVRYELDSDADKTVVVKDILLQQAISHPRGWNTNNSHNRKVKSYQVETNWYENWNDQCNGNCRTPKFLGSFSQEQNQWIILEDLDTNFPLRKQNISISEVKACLKWLANFHAIFLNIKPKGLWEIGTYWNLETRPDEFEKIERQELKSKAHLIDEKLNNCTYQTIVHGDAKLANFCFSADGTEISAVDFQYVGGGCGMKDVAYFLGSCLSSSELQTYEKELLNSYFSELENVMDKSINFSELKEEWRKLYPIACTDFTRFMLGWMPSHQKVNEYYLKMMNDILLGL